jgi:XTP/dITP diphosphohydrolase
MIFLKNETNTKIPMVLATTNNGKLDEFRLLLEGFDVEIKGLKDFGPIPAVKEDGESFEENAVKKACFTACHLGSPSLADDSGLVVKALGGKPGVWSARYAGEGASDRENNLKLLRDMEGVKDRAAFFMCVIAIAAPDGSSLVYQGSCYGVIAKKLIGSSGFGYDPLFYYPPLNKTFAEMTTEEKNNVSHRGKALAGLRSEFEKVLTWLRQRMAGR